MPLAAERQWLLCPEIEVWQHPDGTWNWVMLDRPDPMMEQAVLVYDLQRFAGAREALEDAEQLLARWNGRN